MSALTPSIKELADEAEFQLIVAKEQLEWFGAIARAIALDVEHHEGRDVLVLSQLAKYLDDTGLTGIESAIEQFRQIAATQSAVSESTSLTAEVRP